MYKVARVVIGENKTFAGGEKYLKERGVEVVVFDNEECKDLMSRFIKAKSALWYTSLLQRTNEPLADIWIAACRNEDIGE
jgi:cytosine/creatinine deaminase